MQLLISYVGSSLLIFNWYFCIYLGSFDFTELLCSNFFFLRGFLSISLVTLFKTHSIMLNEMMRVIILALFPVLGELTQYFTLNTILAIDFSQMLFYQVEEIPYFLPSWLKLFPKWVLYLFSIFCVYWKDYIFFIFSINIISCDNQ